jgi:hypothetical protein
MRKYHCLRGEQITDAPAEINRKYALIRLSKRYVAAPVNATIVPEDGVAATEPALPPWTQDLSPLGD